ncbi:hypothetical protein HPP92_012685 [Vanilla planifolia]|uniref:LETM1-like protein n=1 Tax=Vanilla planifolia TaxID=51239 RepID=A0A835QQY4_VANPL|nr:hypothetical protein HPP92_012685 [Vanilla planifolia]
MAATAAVAGGTATGRCMRSITGISEKFSSCKEMEPKYGIYNQIAAKKSCCLRHCVSERERRTMRHRWLEFRKTSLCSGRIRRIVPLTLLASIDDGVLVNRTPQKCSSNDREGVEYKFDQSSHGQNPSTVLLQSIHDAARAIDLAVLEHSSSSKAPWFSKAWLGGDRNGWLKTLSYQAAVHSLLQAVVEVSSCGEGRDRDTNIFVQRSLLRLCNSLETIIRDEFSAKQPSALDWFWSHQHPMTVTTFVNIFEKDPCFIAATAPCLKGESSTLDSTNDLALLMLALSCLAAITKLGTAKVSCTQFMSVLPDTIGRFMDKLLDFLPIQSAYDSMRDIGLRREFLLHFGPRATSFNYKVVHSAEEISFWVHLFQTQLQQAIDRERIWAKLTTCERIEASTQSFLLSNGVNLTENEIEGIVRYLIGGSVLFYPPLSSISSYQLYVEVVCEELEWFPFYGDKPSRMKQIHEKKIKQESISHEEAILVVLDVCLYWTTSFIKYSSWLENPSNIKAASFLSRGHRMLVKYMKEHGVPRKSRKNDVAENQVQLEAGAASVEKELDTFDKALESVERAMVRLENLLQELHVSSSSMGKEHLQAACSDLEKIRKLKKEAEFLEASFRAKGESLEQGDADDDSLSVNLKSCVDKAGMKSDKDAQMLATKSFWLWKFIAPNFSKRAELQVTIADQTAATSKMVNDESEKNEIQRFEHLRNELIELEKRVQQSSDYAQNVEEPVHGIDDDAPLSHTSNHMLLPSQKKDNALAKSFQKIKQTSTDLWWGTQLLAIDLVAAMVLIKRSLTGDEITDKEKKALRRTLTDLASVVPIGFLMLLPVTAVGHAAMLAVIQRYVPSLIPSTYDPERLDLLRQLEKVKELETSELGGEEGIEEISSSYSNPS